MIHIFVLVATRLASSGLLLHGLLPTHVGRLGLRSTLSRHASGLRLLMGLLFLGVDSLLLGKVLDPRHIVAAATNRG